ncbi:hypothetical protein DR996_19275 [Vibrio owensii]|nr:hypothetical protein DR996_19275 [Vibrio owensii]
MWVIPKSQWTPELNQMFSSEDDHQIVIVVEVDPSEIAKLSIAAKNDASRGIPKPSLQRSLFSRKFGVIGNYSGVTELRGSSRQSAQGEEL